MVYVLSVTRDRMAESSIPAARAELSAVRYVQAGEGDAGQRIDNYLTRVLKTAPRSLIYRLLRTGQVRVNGQRAKPERRLQAGDQIRVPPMHEAPKSAPVSPSKSLQAFIGGAIVFEDRDLLVVNKPAGVAVHGGSGLNFGVIEALRALRPDAPELELVHRLDRETSGVLVLAKRRAVLRELHAALREREVSKHYLALVSGRWPFGKKTIDAPLKTNLKAGGERVVKVHAEGLASISTFEPVQTFGRIATLLDVSISTGRTHQIRVHASHAGYPVAGDEKYGDRERDVKLRAFGLNRMFLHAHSLSLKRADGAEFSVTAPLPAELQAVLDALNRGERKPQGA